MLFKVTEHNDVFKDNPELESIEAFAKCTNRQLKFVFYAYDYKSPLRQMQLSDRLDKAARLAGYKTEKGKSILDKNGRNIVAGNVNTVNAAVRVFKEIQHDQDKETLLALDEQTRQIIQLARKEGKDAKELKTSVEISKQLPVIAKIKKELIDILDMRGEIPTTDEVDDTINDEQLSTLDLIHRENDDD